MSAALWSPEERGKGLERVSGKIALRDPVSALRPVLAAIPGWEQVGSDTVTVERISGAMTNLVFRCTYPRAHAFSTVILRLLGPATSLFSQAEERDTFLLAGQTGIGPRCLVEFPGGRVEEFLPGATLSAATMRAPAIAAQAARAVAAFHVRMTVQHARRAAELQAKGRAGPAHARAPALFRRIRKWYASACQLAPEELERMGLQQAMQELDALEAYVMANFPLWLGFCHNDLQYGNMLLCTSADGDDADEADAGAPLPVPGSPTAVVGCDGDLAGSLAGTAECAGGLAAASHSEEEGVEAECEHAEPAPDAPSTHVRLIDFEYATLNDVAFDVANHWCEYAADYHSGHAHVLDFTALPTPEQRRDWARAYVRAIADLARARSARSLAAEADDASALPARILAGAGQGASLDDVAALLVDKAEALMPLSHLKWGLWGVLQAKSTDVDFDYTEYARQRVAQYHVEKARYLA